MDTGRILRSGARTTDLPVLLPVAEKTRRAALIERREGTYRLNMQPRHALLVVVIFALACGSAQAATPDGMIGPLVAIFKWMGFILWGPAGELTGFSLYLIIRFFAMLIGTVAGAALGLMQISL